MPFCDDYELSFHTLGQSAASVNASLERLKCEVEFARRFAELFTKEQPEWERLIIKALNTVAEGLAKKGGVDPEAIVGKAEKLLAPIGKKAKDYTIHCCGHAHIDMNWLWPWPETVNVSHDTFLTADKLMEEFPEFRFSQSQASTYIAMEEYCPEVFQKIRKRVKSGQWEVTASMWVEGEKNFVSGESLCRHLLYTREYMKDKLGLEPEDVKIDWSPDTFGHAHTLPAILQRGGVSRYYFHRAGPGYWLFKWRSPDGSEITAFQDKDRRAYNGQIDPPDMAAMLVDFAKETGLKDYLYVYGVGDHGGGPTRQDLRKAREVSKWPIFPTVKLSTTDAFFTAVEKANAKLPIIDRDLNFVFEGCYTSQSRVKRANRIGEIIIPEAETAALVAGSIAKMPYPADMVTKSWRDVLFNHFHDILPGSGIHATYDYSEGLFQGVQAAAGAITTRAMRVLASKVNTASAAQCRQTTFGGGLGDGLGAGVGDASLPGGLTTYNVGALCAEPVLVYNHKAWPRTETVYAKVWNKELADDRVLVRDSDGNQEKGQVVDRGNYWGHKYITVAFEAKDVPALGYKVYAVDSSPSPVPGEGAKIVSLVPERMTTMVSELGDAGVMENEFLRVEVDSASGAIVHLIDKATGFDYVPEGEFLGVLEGYQEAPNGMSAWRIGQIKEAEQLIDGGRLEITQRGPNRVAVKCTRKYKSSDIVVGIGLNAGSRMVDFNVWVKWLEIGTPETGTPMLRAAFPVNVIDGTATYEIPFGSQQRPQGEQEIPALKWADCSDAEHGLTLVNNSKYGHSCNQDTLRLTLLRSSYSPDPLPEVAEHEISFAVIPHEGSCDVIASTRAGEQFNSPLAIVSATVQKGELSAEKSFVEVLTPNVFISTVKKAERSNAVVIRMFESEGKKTTAKIRVSGIVKPGAKAVETDVLERPLAKNGAKMEGDTISVVIPANGIATVKID